MQRKTDFKWSINSKITTLSKQKAKYDKKNKYIIKLKQNQYIKGLNNNEINDNYNISLHRISRTQKE